MTERTLYRGYCILPVPVQIDGVYEARAAVLALSGDRTRQQRILDFDAYPTEEMAVSRAKAGAQDWIDVELGRRQMGHLPGTTNFVDL